MALLSNGTSDVKDNDDNENYVFLPHKSQDGNLDTRGRNQQFDIFCDWRRENQYTNKKNPHASTVKDKRNV